MAADLPIIDIIPDVKEKLLQHSILILQAPPGAGKSTLLPIQLIQEPWLGNKKIILLEPRRLATRSVANRMADLLHEAIGETIGYRIRFENCVSRKTKIEVVTEGILTRMLQQDNALENVGLIIFDEFHERSLHADLALVLCRQVQQILRADLKILIMSATMDVNHLSQLLNNAPIVSCEGRQYPVHIHYSSIDSKEPIPIFTAKAIKKAIVEQEGDVLVFLPGTGEIKRVQQLLEDDHVTASIYPLFGDLSMQKQQEAILPDPDGKRKIVLATSIAETSLTIEGILIVIDCGYVRLPRFEYGIGLSRLETQRITKDTADQRAGRAGRLGPGYCYRLWTKETQQYLKENRKPEITDADLTPLMLELFAWGVKNINDLLWITSPSPTAIQYAVDLLEQLGAVENNVITKRGKEMVQLPTHPRMAHMLIEANDLCLAIDIAALLDERDVLEQEAGADFVLRIEALRRWRNRENKNSNYNRLGQIEKQAASLRSIFKVEVDNKFPETHAVGKLIAAAYPERIAKQINKNSNRYRLANGRMAQILSHDSLAKEEWLAIAHMDAKNNEGKIFLAAPLAVKDIIHLAKERNKIEWNNEMGKIEAMKEKYIENITVSHAPLEKISDEESVRILCHVIREYGLKILNWNETIIQWQARVTSLKLWRPNEDWPDVSDQKLLETLEEWLAPYLIGKRKRAELFALDVENSVTNCMTWDLNQQLEKLAPAQLKVPSGSMIVLKYFMDGSTPEMPVRLQEVFGLFETPTVNEGRTKILLHLLSPAYRPVQVTQDLKSFWTNTYQEVRKELRIRYKKHSWPEDPFTAVAVKGAIKKKMIN